MNSKKSRKNILSYIIAVLVFIVVAFPLVSLFSASFKTNSEIMTAPEKLFPKAPTLDNYRQAFSSEYFNVGRMLFNSIWFSTVMVIVSVFTASLSGYVFARGRFRGKKLLFGIFSMLMFISLGSITMYPTFKILSFFHLTTSLWGIVIQSMFAIPIVNMYIVRGFVNSLPRDLDEAAKIDGVSFTGIFFRIIFPLLKPTLITIGMLAFNGSWNSYLYPAMFTMTRPEQQTLIVGIMSLKNSSESATNWNLLFAATTIALLPVLIVFLIGNQYITQGMTAGAVKG